MAVSPNIAAALRELTLANEEQRVAIADLKETIADLQDKMKQLRNGYEEAHNLMVAMRIHLQAEVEKVDFLEKTPKDMDPCDSRSQQKDANQRINTLEDTFRARSI